MYYETTYSVYLLILLSITAYGQEPSNNDDGILICPFEPQPTFPGGLVSLKRFLEKNLKYPRGAGYDGNVFVSFIVNEDGSLTGLKIVKGLCDLCDKSALEVFKKMPNWIPAEQDGKPIKVKMIFPIKFKL